MANKKNSFIIIGFVVVMLMTLFVSCSTFPTAPFSTKGFSCSVLGYVGDSFGSYNEAFTVAREKYPNADAVIVIQGTADDNLIPVKKLLGYYAVKFVESEAAPRKKFLGIF
jgi:hypothetical protein